MRVERKKVHERIKLGRRRGTLTAEGAKVLQDTYSKKSQINMLEAKKGMIRQGIAVEGGDEIIEDEAEDEEGEGGVRLADGMMGEDDDLGVGNEGCSEDGGSAPEPVRGHRDPPEPVLMD